MAKASPPPVAGRPVAGQSVTGRCAIYTRKSSEEGLEQDFNSLHAQREACEAYVRSQVGEGWRLLPELYDDGGFSGGNIDRPGLQRLLRDIDHGKIDIVVVYKVDRLTRSLSDFAKVVDRFDAKGASFVSVTQSFNTTTSMGRLTLNMLLSFAQFEREVTGERIRDKIAASKRKGMWMGGNLPLGYDPSGRTLTINAAEAEQVRAIFARYLQVQSVHKLVPLLAAEGVRSKVRIVQRTGLPIGGGPMNRGALFHLLSNRIYRGQIVHKGEAHPGLHPPIIDEDTFAQVQALLQSGRAAPRAPSLRRQSSPLMGKLFDQDGSPMSPTISYGRNGRQYRYYVSAPLQTGVAGARGAADALKRLSGPQIERYLAEQVRRLLDLPADGPEGEALQLIERVQVHEQTVTLQLPRGDHRQHGLAAIDKRVEPGEQAWSDEAGQGVTVSLPVRLKFRGGRAWRPVSPGGPANKTRPDRVLIAALKNAHAMMKAAGMSPLLEPDQMAEAKAPANPYQRRLAELVFLSPDLQRAILEGRQAPGVTLQGLLAVDLPLCWAEQRSLLSSVVFPQMRQAVSPISASGQPC